MSSSVLIKHRKYIMGVAALLIIICHNTIVVGIEPWESILKFCRHFFQLGVDIFLFMSGIGCVFSYSKSRENFKKFYKKRFLRILPTYIIAIFLWYLFSVVVGWEPGFNFLKEYSLISFYIDGSGSEWYVSAIILLYLLFPLFYIIMKKNKSIYISMIITIIIVSFVCSVICSTSNFNEIFVVRIPVYMMGIMIGEKLRNNKCKLYNSCFVKVACYVLCVIILLNYIFNSYNTWWMTRLLFGPTAFLMAMILGWRMEKKKVSRVRNGIALYGEFTLENYLVNEKVITIFACSIYRFINLPILTSILVNVFGAVFTVVVSMLLSKVVNVCTTFIKAEYNRRRNFLSDLTP